MAVAPPDGMQERTCSGLVVHFDEAALREYEADRTKYDEIFAHVSEAHAVPLRRHGQCPIHIMGLGGIYQYGRDKKWREERVELGDPASGIAYFGNLEYEGGRMQESTLFIASVPRMARAAAVGATRCKRAETRPADFGPAARARADQHAARYSWAQHRLCPRAYALFPRANRVAPHARD